MTDFMAGLPKPTNLDEAHAALLSLLSPEQVKGLRSGSLETWQFHHGLGTSIRNQWIRHGQLSRVFFGLEHISIDAMSDIILRSFISKLRGQPFDLAVRVAEVSVVEREYYASLKEPEAASPIDGAKIRWIIVRGHGQGTVHTGVSSSDGTCWRWVYGGSGQVEPAGPDEAARLKLSS